MTIESYLIDMDGVLIRGREMIPGAGEFIQRLRKKKREFLVVTNNSLYAPVDLAHKLQSLGLDIPKEQIFTCAMATAQFLHQQQPTGKAYVVGETGLTEAVHEAGYILTGTNPDYVVLGETHGYNFEQITRAVRLIVGGARFVATNPDSTGPSDQGIVPACGAMAALIEKATGQAPFFIGKPNPFMMRAALNHLGAHSETTVMIGDRMDTDIVAGIQSGMQTVLVLTGVTKREEVNLFPYRPQIIRESVADIEVL